MKLNQPSFCGSYAAVSRVKAYSGIGCCRATNARRRAETPGNDVIKHIVSTALFSYREATRVTAASLFEVELGLILA